jgi:hypothetical protein
MRSTSRANKNSAAPLIGRSIGGAPGVAEGTCFKVELFRGDCKGGESRGLILDYPSGFELGLYISKPTQPGPKPNPSWVAPGLAEPNGHSTNSVNFSMIGFT